MNDFPRSLAPLRLIAAAVALLLTALASGCNKKIEEPPTPAVAVMPSDAPAAVDANAPASAPAVVDSASAAANVVPPAATNVEGGGTVSVISGTAPTPAPVGADTSASAPRVPLTAGLPPARSASLPGATTIGPGAAPSDQPPSVSPGTTK